MNEEDSAMNDAETKANEDDMDASEAVVAAIVVTNEDDIDTIDEEIATIEAVVAMMVVVNDEEYV
jgi:hypothetical protein